MKLRLFYIFSFLIFIATCAQIAIHPLTDPDLGWHLAGGQWILENGAVPWKDPLSNQGNHWINYSWLAEILFYKFLNIGGHNGLGILQTFLSLISSLVIYSLARKTADKLPSTEEGKICIAVISSLLAVFLIAPFWHLRPQLIGVIAVGALMLIDRRDKRALSYFSIIEIPLANIHIYWIFIPLVWIFYRGTNDADCGSDTWTKRFSHGAFLIILGVISPYGLNNFQPIFSYAFNHSVAYGLIDEFQPLFEMPLECLACLIVALLSCIGISGKRSYKNLQLPLLFFLATIGQRKYLAIFAVFVTPLLTTGIARLLPKSGAATGIAAKRVIWFELVLIALVALNSPWLLDNNQLGERQLGLLNAQQVLLSASSGKDGAILTHLNDGGWLEYWMSYASKEKRLKTVIDGRTLVMGEKKLAQYLSVSKRESGSCEVVEQWGAAWAILPVGSSLESLLQDECKRWYKIKADSLYSVWVQN